MARPLHALGDVLVTVLAAVPVEACAVVVVDEVGTGGVVLARTHGALVDVELAVVALEAGALADADIRIDPVDAVASV